MKPGRLVVMAVALSCAAAAIAPDHPQAQRRSRRARAHRAAATAHGIVAHTFSSLPTVLSRVVGSDFYRLHRWTIPLDEVELDLDYVPRPTSIERALRATRARLVVNAGFFHGSGAPAGLTYAHGREITPFDPRLVGGVLTVDDGRAHLHATEGFVRPPGVELALQSKPRLLVDRTVNTSDDRYRADRTAVCIRDEGRVLDLYVARSDHATGRGGPTLRGFARVLAELGCHHALNLDGGPSTSAAWRDGARVRVLPPRDPIRQVIVVRARAARSTTGESGTGNALRSEGERARP